MRQAEPMGSRHNVADLECGAQSLERREVSRTVGVNIRHRLSPPRFQTDKGWIGVQRQFADRKDGRMPKCLQSTKAREKNIFSNRIGCGSDESVQIDYFSGFPINRLESNSIATSAALRNDLKSTL